MTALHVVTIIICSLLVTGFAYGSARALLLDRASADVRKAIGHRFIVTYGRVSVFRRVVELTVRCGPSVLAEPTWCRGKFHGIEPVRWYMPGEHHALARGTYNGVATMVERWGATLRVRVGLGVADVPLRIGGPLAVDVPCWGDLCAGLYAAHCDHVSRVGQFAPYDRANRFSIGVEVQCRAAGRLRGGPR